MNKINYLSKLLIIISIILNTSCSTPLVKMASSNIGSLYDDVPKVPKIVPKSNGNNDLDKDGIINSLDKCKEVPETYNFFADEDGCPDKAPYPDTTMLKTFVKIFDENTGALTEDVKGSIQLDLLYLLLDYPNTDWIIEVRSPFYAEKKAKILKDFVDSITKQTYRTRTSSAVSISDEVYFILDKEKAREIISHNIYRSKN